MRTGLHRYMVRYILGMLLLIIVGTPSFCKGGQGEYVLTGTAFDRNNRRISNGIIYVEFNGRKDTIKTNSSGGYILAIPWQTVCPSFYIFDKIENDKLNPESIYLTFQEDHVEVENKWEEYAEESIPVKMDLRFCDYSVNAAKTYILYVGCGLSVATIFFMLKKRAAKTKPG